MREITIGQVSVGDNSPARFMAELGTFYNQDIEKALELVDLAAASGADIIKSEILHSPNIVLDREDVMVHYNHTSGTSSEKYYDLIKRKCVSLENYKILIEHTKKQGLPFVASVYDFKGVDFLVNNGGAAIKIWRNNFNNFPLLQCAGETKLPVIFDFAFTAPSDMLKAVETVLKSGANGVCVNYHPGHNPTPANHHDLRLIQTYKSLFNSPVGLSCHYRGEEIMYAAIGAGVNLVEKGVYDNVDEADQNVISATSSTNLKSTIDAFKGCAAAMGNGVFQTEKENTIGYGFVVKQDLKKGDKITWNNVALAFPNKGIGCDYSNLVLGSIAATDLVKDESLLFDHISNIGK